MNRMWEIREGDSDRYSRRMMGRAYRRSGGSMSMREPGSEYDEGFEEGYKCALEAVKKAVHKEMEGME